jgi:mannose/fructose/N-acetylgalactosamine-specific phosphotransferase system component IIB
MPIVLLRVDERLIHGQVVVGWGERLHIDRIIVVDDELSDSAWEQELYCLGVPPTVDATFSTVAAARSELSAWKTDGRRIAVLVRDVPTLARLAAEGALRDQEVNLGGIHHAAGRERVLPYLFLSEEEMATLRSIEEQGVRVEARDLPSSRGVPLDQLVDEDR